MKKHILWVICFILMSFSCVWAEEVPTELPDVKIIIDNEQKVFTDIPIAVNGYTLLPLRQCLTYLGVPNDDQHIIWNQSDRSVTVKHNSTEIYLKVYDDKAKVNGKEITLPAASTIYKGRTYIPVRFVAEALNKNVTWDGKERAVYITEAVPETVPGNASSGALTEDKPASDVISGRSSSEDYEKISDLKTLEQVIAAIGQGKKVDSESEEYFTWGSLDSGAYIEISLCNGKVRSSGNSDNYQDDKYQKIDLGMTYDQVIAILGEGKKSRTEVTDIYEWVYSDGGTIQIMIKDNRISGRSKF